MNSVNPILLPPFLLSLLIFLSSASCSTFSIAKPGCEDHCGNIKVPFPFGTQEGCYLHEEFFINCSDFIPFTGNVEVIDISLEGQIRLLHNMAHNCYNPKNDTQTDIFDAYTLVSSCFAFNNTKNRFTAIGCDTYSILKGRTKEHTYTTGCMSMCDHREDVVSGSCSGSGCCQIAIPNGAWEINVSVETYHNHSSVWDFNPCSYGFVVEENAFQFFTENLTNIDKYMFLPVLVDWVVEYDVKCEKAKMNLSSYACTTENSECVDQLGAIGYRCKCKDGFQGNPYLPNNGCQDIDECASPNFPHCDSHSTCYNTLGSYKCICNKGYHFNGLSYINECIGDVPPHKILHLYWPIFTVVGGCVIVVVLSYIWYLRLMTQKKHSWREKYFRKNGGLLLQEKLSVSQRENNGYSIRIFTYAELEKATNNFGDSQIIGQGSFGNVYRGDLIDKTVVAIKKSGGINHCGVEQFIDDVILLSRINSKNAVKLFGCCLETEIPLLVYEFINNGTLFEHLKDTIKNHESKLSWNIRMRIASQVAEVLFYLHSCASPQIIHKNIKSSNILLDQDYMAKVTNFGISRLVPIIENQFSTVVQGTIGYLDPEYLQTGILTEKSDVYSFGVVLIEILTGKQVFSTERPESERFLANHFIHHLNDDNLAGVLDYDYNTVNFELMKDVAMIVKRCISMKGEDRPQMKEVLKNLQILEKKYHEVPKALEIASKECKVFVGEQHSGACSSSDDHNSTYSFGDLYPVNATKKKNQDEAPITI